MPLIGQIQYVITIYVCRYKRRGLERRRCCYKNDEEVQCKNIIVPYTNHCIKRILLSLLIRDLLVIAGGSPIICSNLSVHAHRFR